MTMWDWAVVAKRAMAEEAARRLFLNEGIACFFVVFLFCFFCCLRVAALLEEFEVAVGFLGVVDPACVCVGCGRWCGVRI